MSPSTGEHLGVVLGDLARLLDDIDERQRHDPTPCTDYDVAQLREHVLGWLTTFTAGFADPRGRAPRADLAAATGQPWDPPGARESLEFAPEMLSKDHQGEGKTFGPRVSVPTDDPALDRLLGLSGRDPHWKPPTG